MATGTTKDEFMVYHEEFDKLTRNGKVMDHDLSAVDGSLKNLTDVERDARKEWMKTIQRLILHYKKKSPPEVNQPDDILCMRLVPPTLAVYNVSSSSKQTESRALRSYPEEILEWTTFERNVEGFSIPDGDTALESVIFKSKGLTYDSLWDAQAEKCSNESQEQGWLQHQLTYTLVRSKIVPEILVKAGLGRMDLLLMKKMDVDEEAYVDDDSGPASKKARMDDELGADNKVLTKQLPGDIAVCIEVKTTQNLRLPILASDTVEKYRRSYDEMRDRGRRLPTWSNIAHPLGQLLGYMVSNSCRYGALTSATRTYFIFIFGKRGDAKVYITDAWFTGQPNYLRAWAYIHSLGREQGEDIWGNELVWKKSTTDENSRSAFGHYNPSTDGQDNDDDLDDDSDGDNGKPTAQGSNAGGKSVKTFSEKQMILELASASASALTSSFPVVPFSEISLVDVLGTGRNGCCFRVKWKGQEVAMKQFDVGRDGATGFEKEVLAYTILRSEWGVRVPKPLFLSESPGGGSKLLGLQMGRSLNSSDWNDFLWADWRSLLNLLKKHGIRHNDAEGGRNALFITDDSGVERLGVIDFEDWDYVQKKDVKKMVHSLPVDCNVSKVRYNSASWIEDSSSGQTSTGVS